MYLWVQFVCVHSNFFALFIALQSVADYIVLLWSCELNIILNLEFLKVKNKKYKYVKIVCENIQLEKLTN